MRRIATFLVAVSFVPLAWAALAVGKAAPDFTAEASLGGKTFTFKLAEALKKGPVVLYFYPAAFTPGCTIEAHLFAEASDEFASLGATVIGMSHDDIDTLSRFSVSECRSKFAVAADPELKVATQYDALLASHAGYASRTSYVITPDGRIRSALDDARPEPHVKNALAVLHELQKPREAPPPRDNY